MYRLALALALSALLAVPVSGHDWSRQVQRVLPSIVSLHIENADSEIGQHYACTAWYVSCYHAVTANHCLMALEKAYTDAPIRKRYKVRYRDEVHDLAMLTFADAGYPLRLGSHVKLGEPLLAIGYRSGILLLRRGIAASYEDTTFFQGFAPGQLLDTNFIGGMSGGPIINYRSEVVGVVLGGGHPMTSFGNTGYAANAQNLRAFVERLYH